MITEGWVSIHRKIMKWEWYTDIVVKTLFIHCLLKANHTTKEWRGKTIKRGQFITSLGHLASETGLSVKQVRRALDALELTKELGTERTKVNTCITVSYYEDYQSEGTQKANKGHTGGQRKGKERATTNNDNNENNELNNENKCVVFSEFETIAKEYCQTLNLEYSESKVKSKFLAWSEDNWVDGNGNKILNWKSKLRNTLPHILSEKEYRSPKARPSYLGSIL